MGTGSENCDRIEIRKLALCGEVVIMAARLTDRQRQKIVADYLELGSYRAAARKNGVAHQTVKRVLQEQPDLSRKLQQKKEENTADILAYMESQRQQVCDIIETGLRVLPEKIAGAKTATDVTTAMGTLIDKWTAISGSPADSGEEDDLSRSLRELGKELESDGYSEQRALAKAEMND